MRLYVIIKIKVLCPRSGSHRKVKQNDNLCPVQDWFLGCVLGHSQGSRSILVRNVLWDCFLLSDIQMNVSFSVIICFNSLSGFSLCQLKNH